MDGGEIRFRSAQSARRAAETLDNSFLMGQQISVEVDRFCPDGTKVIVTNMPAGIAWQDLKDHFAQSGDVHFASVSRTGDRSNSKGGFGWAQAGHPCVGEVRFCTREQAMAAMDMFNGQAFKDGALSIRPDQSSAHGTKLLVFGVPVGTSWEELRDHFEKAGQVAFAGIDVLASKGKRAAAAWGGKGGGSMMTMMQPMRNNIQAEARGEVGEHWVPPTFSLSDGYGREGFQSAADGGRGWIDNPGFPLVGEVRFENALSTAQAIAALTGTRLGAGTVTVVQDGGCKDGSRVLVLGLMDDVSRHSLREHFERIGPVAFAGWKGKGFAKGFGKGGAKPFYGAAEAGTCNDYAERVSPYAANGFGQGGLLPARCFVEGSAVDQRQAPRASVAEVQFAHPLEAERAIVLMNGSHIGLAPICVVRDDRCKDGVRILVFGVPEGTPPKVLLDHFGVVGTVCHAGFQGLHSSPTL